MDCKHCKQVFEPKQQFCSDNCRKRHNDGRKRPITTDDNVLNNEKKDDNVRLNEDKPKNEATESPRTDVIVRKVITPVFDTTMCKNHVGSMRGTCGCK